MRIRTPAYGGPTEAERLRAVHESLAARLWALVDRTGGLAACWPWQGALTSSGYGHMADGTGHFTGPHRAAYLVTHGTIDPQLTIDHLCRNKVCCNPAHLELVTRGENGLRGDTVQARNKGKTHCPKGHAYTPENTRVSKRNQRTCRTCNREAARASRAARPREVQSLMDRIHYIRQRERAGKKVVVTCDFCEREGNVPLDGWHVLRDPLDLEGTWRVSCLRQA